MTDDHHRSPFQTRDTADDGFVISIGAIARQLIKLIKRQTDIIQGVRTLRMARQLGYLPCAEIGKDFARQFYAFFAQAMDFFIDINIQFLILRLTAVRESIFASSSAIGCSKSRKFRLIVFLY